ncbi:SCO3374 family protein [Streptomyces bambusae]|uniref:SCO3374 family protein n=1 Tax=Streptomyces bambusae TaxID=1550616 RepID=UPI001CFFF206|nr:SCO3374 family protein [Streptomyces bambusae]MCB5169918.1 SCO3374 family protein [Streptomyces bambusae]
MWRSVPFPQAPFEPSAPVVPPPDRPGGLDGVVGEAVAHWYAHVLGWPVAGGNPVQLVTGIRFDVLEMPAGAGYAVLRRGIATGPVALLGRRMRMLVAPGTAEELDGLLDWLEWGGIALDLGAVGAGGRITAPLPPALAGAGAPGDGCQGPAVWLRPPEPGGEALLPSTAALGRPAGTGTPGGVPDLVRLVGAAATECHRARLLRTPSDQALAFS